MRASSGTSSVPYFIRKAGLGTATCPGYPAKGPQGPYLSQFLHPTEAGVQKAKQLLDTWLSTIGLELKPSKTRITHTIWEYQGHLGFDLSSLDHPTISGGQN